MLDPRGARLGDHIGENWPVEDVEHVLGRGLGAGQHAGPQTRHRQHHQSRDTAQDEVARQRAGIGVAPRSLAERLRLAPASDHLGRLLHAAPCRLGRREEQCGQRSLRKLERLLRRGSERVEHRLVAARSLASRLHGGGSVDEEPA